MTEHQDDAPLPAPTEQSPQSPQPPEAPCDDEQDTMGFTGLGFGALCE